MSNESGQDEVYVRPYPGPGGEEIVSTGGGQEPVWASDGRELFYRNGERLLVVPVETGPSFAMRTPELLFQGKYDLDRKLGGNPNYDVSPDGEQFIMVRSSGESERETAQMNVVLNWTEELKRLVPIKE